jgi:hypothetical protein
MLSRALLHRQIITMEPRLRVLVLTALAFAAMC